MTCQELAEFLFDYHGGNLSEAFRQAFAEHLGACPHCIAYLRSYEMTIKLSKFVGAEENQNAGDDVPNDLILAILEARDRFG